MTDRSEQREEIKLKIEYAKILISAAGILAVVIAILQLQASNRASNLAAYQKMTGEWREHLKTFIDNPSLRPYFEMRKDLSENDSNRDKVLAIADIRLDVADALLTYAAYQGFEGIDGWENTIANAFKTSPALCRRFQEVRSSFANAKITRIALSHCRAP